MILNAIWLLFFFGAFIACIVQWLALGNSGIFNSTILAAFDMSKTAFEIALGLTGVLSLWLGILKIGEKAGAKKANDALESVLDATSQEKLEDVYNNIDFEF